MGKVKMAYTSLRDVPKAVADLKPVKGNSIHSEWRGDAYVIYSYSTLMAEIRGGMITYLDNRKYSVTTSKHQGAIGRGLHGRAFSPVAIIHSR